MSKATLASLALVLIVTAGAAPAYAALVEVQEKEGATATIPTSADPRYSVDPGLKQSGSVEIVRVFGNGVDVPTYTVTPTYTFDPGFTYEEKSVPGYTARAHSPATVRVTKVTRVDGEYLQIIVGGDANGDGVQDSYVPITTPVCYCPGQALFGKSAWYAVYRLIPEVTLGQTLILSVP